MCFLPDCFSVFSVHTNLYIRRVIFSLLIYKIAIHFIGIASGLCVCVCIPCHPHSLCTLSMHPMHTHSNTSRTVFQMTFFSPIIRIPICMLILITTTMVVMKSIAKKKWNIFRIIFYSLWPSSFLLLLLLRGSHTFSFAYCRKACVHTTRKICEMW